jgi:hypothetical protein
LFWRLSNWGALLLAHIWSQEHQSGTAAWRVCWKHQPSAGLLCSQSGSQAGFLSANSQISVLRCLLSRAI